MSNSSAFPLYKAIDRHPLTVAPDTPASEAIGLMSQARASYVLIVRSSDNKERGSLLGIFTERDVVKVTASGMEIEGVEIRALMTEHPVVLTKSKAQDILTVLNLFRQYGFRHLPIVDAANKLIGIITHQSIREVIKPADWMRLRRVSEVMTTAVVYAPADASVLVVTQLMAHKRVSCVVITENRVAEERESLQSEPAGDREDEEAPHSTSPELRQSKTSITLIPVGIVTERDIVQFRALGLNFAQTPVQKVMSTPLLPTAVKDSLWEAHEKMRRHHIRRLVVVGEAGELAGVVTQTSLLRSLDPTEVDAAIEALQKLVEERTTELWQAYEGLQCEIHDRQQTETALRISQARMAGILNTAEDAIISVDEAQRIQMFNQGAEKIFGYATDEVLGQPFELLLPLGYTTATCQYIFELAQPTDVEKMGGGARREIWGRRKDGNEFPAEASISKLEVERETLLTIVLRDITERKQSEKALRNQIARERLIATISQRIRQSLEIDKILNTTVGEVRQFLKADRVIIYRFNPDWSGVVTVESAGSKWPSILGTIINDHCFISDYAKLYENGRIQATEDIYNAGMLQCHVDLLKPLQVRANLVVPILQSSPEFRKAKPLPESLPGTELETEPNSIGTQLWGLLGVHQCSKPRQWQEWEIDLLKQLATQVAIAIQQGELYERLIAANQQLRQLASLDGLTQVANRRRFDEYLQQEWRRLARDRAPLSLILGDVDFFKAYNDTYGHIAGDICLQQVANALRAAVKRSADLVARYGGEEFAVILPNTSDIGAAHVAQEIQSRVKALKIDHPKSQVSQHVTLSLGIATTVPVHKTSSAILLALADKALYQAKGQGRNCVVAYIT